MQERKRNDSKIPEIKTPESDNCDQEKYINNNNWKSFQGVVISYHVSSHKSHGLFNFGENLLPSIYYMKHEIFWDCSSICFHGWKKKYNRSDKDDPLAALHWMMQASDLYNCKWALAKMTRSVRHFWYTVLHLSKGTFWHQCTYIGAKL